jgi:U3 small nucleolar RNA-associated protein 10
MKSNNPHSRNLAYLVCRVLPTQFSGMRQVEIAHKILKASDIISLEGMDDFLRGSENLDVVLSYSISLMTTCVELCL